MSEYLRRSGYLLPTHLRPSAPPYTPMFFPYNTDAPIYHWPYATVLLITVNIVVQMAAFAGDVATYEWMLRYDGALHPAQWITSSFVHLDAIHLLGNMFFLWPFGMLVEGKVGWWKFLLIYLGIGIAQSAVEQVLMLPFASSSVEGSLGASAIVFGLLGVAWVWAPRNDVSCVLLFFFRIVEFEISILMFGALLVAKELFFVVFGITGGSELLHISGAAIGIGVGLAMLKLKLVDCEGYDVLSVFRGTEGQVELTPLAGEEDRSPDEPTDFQQQAARAQFRQYLKREDPGAALMLRHKLQQQGQPLDLERSELAALITALHKKQRWRDSAPVMAEYLEMYTQNADRVRMKLAQICLLELDRPLRALELLKSIEATALSDDDRKLLQRLVARAKKMEAEGTLELDDGKW